MGVNKDVKPGLREGTLLKIRILNLPEQINQKVVYKVVGYQKTMMYYLTWPRLWSEERKQLLGVRS